MKSRLPIRPLDGTETHSVQRYVYLHEQLDIAEKILNVLCENMLTENVEDRMLTKELEKAGNGIARAVRHLHYGINLISDRAEKDCYTHGYLAEDAS